jgi:hypothetical protein
MVSITINIDFAKMFSEDPLFSAMTRGEKKWGDLFEERPTTPTGGAAAAAAEIPFSEIPLSEFPTPDDAPWAPAKAHREPRAPPTPIKMAPLTPVKKTCVHHGIRIPIKTIIARNLPRDISVQELRAIFERHGIVADVYIPKNMDASSPYYGTTKGFALIKYTNYNDSNNAYLAEYGILNIRGKNIQIEFASKDK